MIVFYDSVVDRIGTIDSSTEKVFEAVTSKPYPVFVVEEMAVTSADLLRGTHLRPPLDEINTVGTVLSGTLRLVLQTYAYAESIDTSASIPSGTLRVVLETYAYAESIDASASLQPGTLEIVLIQYTNWPAEGIDASASLVSGTLT